MEKKRRDKERITVRGREWRERGKSEGKNEERRRHGEE